MRKTLLCSNPFRTILSVCLSVCLSSAVCLSVSLSVSLLSVCLQAPQTVVPLLPATSPTLCSRWLGTAPSPASTVRESSSQRAWTRCVTLHTHLHSLSHTHTHTH